jgi:hypothetical protein
MERKEICWCGAIKSSPSPGSKGDLKEFLRENKQSANVLTVGHFSSGVRYLSPEIKREKRS